MRNYTIVDTAPRFEGDLKLEPKADEAADLVKDPAYIALGTATETLANHEKKDVAGNYPEALLAGRKKERKTTGATLRTIAQKFIDESLSSNEAAKAIDEEVARYTKAVPKHGLRDKTPPDFEGDFELVSAEGYQFTEAETRYSEKLRALLQEMAADAKSAPADGLSESVAEERVKLRTRFAGMLKERAQAFCANKISASEGADLALILTGRYRSIRDRLKRTLFNVSGLKASEAKTDDLLVDLSINLLGGLPAPENMPSPEKEELFVRISKTTTTIRLLCDRMKEPPRTLFGKAKPVDARAVDRANRILHEYVDKLRGVAIVGLQQSHTQIAKIALDDIKTEFAVEETMRLKERYVYKLGAASALFAIAFMVVYVWVRHSGWPWGVMHAPFLLAGVGAAVGAWVSFSARQVIIPFDELLLADDSTLDPPLRILFVVALTWTACLLFWTGTFNMEIGTLKTSAEALQKAGSIALLIGIFCGLSERALATAISGRAASFVQGIGGGR